MLISKVQLKQFYSTPMALVISLARWSGKRSFFLNNDDIVVCTRLLFLVVPVNVQTQVVSLQMRCMLDVFPSTYPTAVLQCRHTAFVLSTCLFPSSYFTLKPKCSQTEDLRFAGGSSGSSGSLAMLSKCENALHKVKAEIYGRTRSVTQLCPSGNQIF